MKNRPLANVEEQNEKKIMEWIKFANELPIIIFNETENDDVEDKASPANELPHMELMDGHDSRHSRYKSGLSSV